MKILILSDIHGNIDALQSIAEPFDELWVLGDLVNYGPNPSEVVDFVRANAAMVVRGNHDNAIGAGEDPRCAPPFREMARVMQSYTESVLNPEQKAYLRNLPLTERRTPADRTFFLCHAAPSDPLFRYAPPEPEIWVPEVRTVEADTLLVGHTHLPFNLRIGTQRVVNPGSVGQPKHGAPEACYAVWEDGVVTLKTAPYPAAKVVRHLSTLPVDAVIKEQLSAVLLSGVIPG